MRGISHTIMLFTIGFILTIPLAFIAQAQSTPKVTITNPSENDIVGIEVHVEGTASEDAKGVEIKIDAEDFWDKASLGTGGKWSFLWNTTGYTNDYHTIYARAYNGSMRSEAGSVRVLVDNTPPESIHLEVSLNPEEVRPNKNVTVSGFAEYDNSVKIGKASLKIEIVDQGIERVTTTKADGYFSEKLQAPEYAGDYVIRTLVSDGTLSAQEDRNMRVRDPDQPDLVVSSITIDPEKPRDGDEITITARIDNIGIQEASTRVKFYIDGDLTGSEDITVLESNTATIKWYSHAGNHTVRVEAVDVVPMDKDSSNNEDSQDFYVRAMSRLAIEDLVISNPMPADGDLITIQVKVRNRGDVTATGNLVVYLGQPSDDIRISERHLSVGPNETEFFFIDWNAVEGNHKIYAKAFLETEEESLDHVKSKDIAVGPAPPEPKEQPSVGVLGLILALVVAASVKYVLSRRRH